MSDEVFLTFASLHQEGLDLDFEAVCEEDVDLLANELVLLEAKQGGAAGVDVDDLSELLLLDADQEYVLMGV